MESIANGVINVHVDPKDKEQATLILKDLGLNMTTFINMALKQTIKRNGLPFEVINPKPSKETIKALQEAEDIINGQKYAKGYRNIEELKKDLLSDN